MSRYRKKPVVIEAFQWFPAMGAVGPVVIDACYGLERADGGGVLTQACPHVHTLDGPLLVKSGDWIITGVKGECYPCKPDIFEATYDPA